MIHHVTGWFEITEYNYKGEISVEKLFETT